MAIPTETIWDLDPHTTAKHEILRRYLQRWFPILNTYHEKVVYIDGFCGPGRYKGGEPGSPLIALDVALNHRRTLKGEIVFWFVDEKEDRIKHLKTELKELDLPPQFRVSPQSGQFDKELSGALDRLDKQQGRMAPTFAFIDPFGFSCVPFKLIERLLKRTRCEVLINFMVDPINRFVEHPNPQIVNHVAELYGTDEYLQIIQNSSDRVLELRNLYQRQLKKVARFVRYFEMRDGNNKIQYYLFFASNHPLGHVKMKEAMWAVDSKGEFRFSDATNPFQQVLFEADETIALWPILYEQFSGQEILTERILEFVNNETAFLETHMKATLRKHLAESLPLNQRISARETKADGKKWRSGTFPSGVFVTFPS